MIIIIVISYVNRSYRSTGPEPRLRSECVVYGQLNNRQRKTTRDQGLNAERMDQADVH